VLGASPWRVWREVDLPMVRRALLIAAGFAFAVSLGEFGATSFLARDDHPTLPVVIYRLLGHPGELNYGMALAASVVLAATTALVVLAVERLRVPSTGAF
jgi:thiamine transport system permease protein